MSARWRLLDDGPAPGPWNMAVDEALLRALAQGAPPTLRFYTWDGAWLSLGLAQRIDAARVAACRAAGVGLVRRATGGRAVLHGADLTYAVVAPPELLPEGLLATYGRIAEALARGLADLGVAVERSPVHTGPRPADFDCFQAPAPEELCVAGRKLVGSAQRRTAAGVLQHGSLRLRPDPAAARAAAGLGLEGATSLLELGCMAGVEEVRRACAGAFARVLGVALLPGGLEVSERDLAEQLVHGYYALLPDVPSGFSREPAAGR